MIKPQKVGHHQEASAEADSLFTEEGRQLGNGIKGDDLFKLPNFYVACVFKSTQKRSREKRGGSGETSAQAEMWCGEGETPGPCCA